MAISEEWTSPNDLEVGVGDLPRASWANAVLGNTQFLYGGPRFTVVRNTNLTVESQSDTLLEWTSALVDQGGWYFPETSGLIVPRDGVYMLSFRLLWPSTAGGTYRRMRFLRNGDAVGGERTSSVVFTEQCPTIITGLEQGRNLGIDVRHDAGEDLTLTPSTDPWRSPIFMGQWIAPLGAVA